MAVNINSLLKGAKAVSNFLTKDRLSTPTKQVAQLTSPLSNVKIANPSNVATAGSFAVSLLGKAGKAFATNLVTKPVKTLATVGAGLVGTGVLLESGKARDIVLSAPKNLIGAGKDIGSVIEGDKNLDVSDAGTIGKVLFGVGGAVLGASVFALGQKIKSQRQENGMIITDYEPLQPSIMPIQSPVVQPQGMTTETKNLSPTRKRKASKAKKNQGINIKLTNKNYINNKVIVRGW